MLSSSVMAAALSGIVRATPDFMCAAGTFQRLPSISLQVAWRTSPVLGQQASNSSSSARAAVSGRCRNSAKKRGRSRQGIAGRGFTTAETRGKSRKTLLQGLEPLNRAGSTAIACSIVCSIRPRTRRAVSLVVSQTA